jgi:hypothetical protein
VSLLPTRTWLSSVTSGISRSRSGERSPPRSQYWSKSSTARSHISSSLKTPTPGTTHHDFPRLVEDIAYDRDNKVLVLTGTGNTFIDSIDGPSLGDITKPWTADATYLEGRRGVQRLVDLEIPIVAAVNGPVSVHSEYALLADVVIASETAVFSDFPHLAFGIARETGSSSSGRRSSD